MERLKKGGHAYSGWSITERMCRKAKMNKKGISNGARPSIKRKNR